MLDNTASLFPFPNTTHEARTVTDTRATGWKIPLIFCAVIIVCISIVSLFRDEKPLPPDIPAGLLQKAQAIHIDLAADPEGQDWKSRIASAAGGFSSPADKDTRLTGIIRRAIEEKRFDAACTAAVLIRDDEVRDGLMARIADTAAADCSTLPWGVLGLHGLRDPGRQSETAALLTQRWGLCYSGKE